LAVGVAVEIEERLPPPSRPRPRPSGGFSSFLSGFLGSVTKTATVSDCPGKCIHSIASLICDQVLENVDCGNANMRCCVEKGGGMPPLPNTDGLPPLPNEKEDKVATTTTEKTTTTEATTTTKKKRRRKKKTTTTSTTTTTTTTTTKTTTTALTTKTTPATTTEDSDDYEDPEYEYTSPANNSRLSQSIATICLAATIAAFFKSFR